MNFELAVKRSGFADKMSDSDFLSLIRQTTDARVNFDAEDLKAMQGGYRGKWETSQLRQILDHTHLQNCSETCQTSALYAKGRADEIFGLVTLGLGISANFVSGNKRYRGVSGDTSTLTDVVDYFYSKLDEFQVSASSETRHLIKIGAEGLKNGTAAAELCAKHGAILYVLQNDNAHALLSLAQKYGLETAMYTIVRFNTSRLADSLGRSRETALKDLLRIVGKGYFNRRGVQDKEIRKKAGLYMMYGSIHDVADQVATWKSAGAKTVVFNIAFEGARDLEEQLGSLIRMTRRFDYKYSDHQKAEH